MADDDRKKEYMELLFNSYAVDSKIDARFFFSSFANFMAKIHDASVNRHRIKKPLWRIHVTDIERVGNTWTDISFHIFFFFFFFLLRYNRSLYRVRTRCETIIQ